MTQKNLYIRCSQATYDIAHALAKVESRSLNKQIIHMIHKGGFILDNLKKEANEILDEKKQKQLDIIKAFSKKEIKLATLREMEDFQKQDDLSEKSTHLHPTLLSESYAKILVKQGKKQKAKEIYQKLMVKFPDKNTYFADLIKELDL